MTTTIKPLLCLLGLATGAVLTTGCNDAPSMVVAVNGYGDAWVYKVWWNTVLVADPLAPGATSASERAVPGNDFAYALIALGVSPEVGGRPLQLIPLRSVAPLSVARGSQLEIRVFDDSFAGNCAAAGPLPPADARFIVERIFPGAFAGATYDPMTCATTSAGADAAADQ